MTLKILYDPVSNSVPTYTADAVELRTFPSTAKIFSTRPLTPSYAIRLCLNESTADLGATLAGREAGLLLKGGLGALLDLLIGLGEDELDVAGVGHVRVDLG